MKKITMFVLMMTTISVFADDVNSIARNLIARNEGFRANVYVCTAGKQTIGYGFTAKRLIANKSMYKAEADKVLAAYVDKCMQTVNQLDIKVQLTDNQKAVLCDMIYHFGSGAIINASDLLTAINSGNSNKVKTQLMRWNKQRVVVNGKVQYKVVAGLTNRQARLCQLWNR